MGLDGLLAQEQFRGDPRVGFAVDADLITGGGAEPGQPTALYWQPTVLDNVYTANAGTGLRYADAVWAAWVNVNQSSNYWETHVPFALLSRELDASDILATVAVPVHVTHGQEDAPFWEAPDRFALELAGLARSAGS